MKKVLFILTTLLFINASIAQTEPANQASNLNFSNLKTYKGTLSFTTSGADGHLVLLSKNPITFTPTDNVDYPKGQYINGAKVINNGVSTFTGFKNIYQNTTYYVAVFAYNQSGNNINYKSDNPLTGSFTTPEAKYGNYYNGIDFSASDVVNQLTNLIQPHTQLSYHYFDENVVRNINEKDTLVNGSLKSYIKCEYSNEIKVYNHQEFAYQATTPYYSREHRMPKAWYNFTNSSSETDLPEGSDYHSLALVQGEVNTKRSDLPMGIVVNPTYEYLDFTVGWDAFSNGTLVAEPRDDRKGDIARANFYIMLCYNGKYNENWGLDNLIANADKQDIQTLLDWHYNDLPDDFEKTRHEYVAEIQGNRNPLIDFPELVDCIDFTDMTKKANCNIEIETGISNVTKSEFGNFVYPNPSTGIVHISKPKIKDIEKIRVFDLLGAEQNNYTFDGDSLNLSHLNKGTYIISIQGKRKKYINKILLK